MTLPGEISLNIGLEFLSEDKVELAAAFLAEHLVETVGPVDTHHADHRQIDADTGTGAALEVKRCEALDIGPGVTCLNECQAVDGGRL